MTTDATWCLYMIECRGGRIYTGITNRLDARYASHCTGKGAKFTRAFPPVRMLGSTPFPDRSAASKAEYAMKKLSAVAKRKLWPSAA